MQWLWLIYSYSSRDLARSDFYSIPQTDTPDLSFALNHRQIQIWICCSCRMVGTKLDMVHPWPAMHSKIQTSRRPHPMDPNHPPFLTPIINSLNCTSFILYILSSSTTSLACIFKWVIILSTQEAQPHLQSSSSAHTTWTHNPWALWVQWYLVFMVKYCNSYVVSVGFQQHQMTLKPISLPKHHWRAMLCEDCQSWRYYLIDFNL